MASYEVVEIVTSGLSRNDCRCIDILRCVDGDGTEMETRASQAYFDVKNGDTYYVEDDEQRHELRPATKFNTRYVRALPHDDADDPLLNLPEARQRRRSRRSGD